MPAATMSKSTTKAKAENTIPMMHVPKGVLCIGKVTNEDSPTLSCVHVVREKGGQMRAEATDGRRAVVVEWRDTFLLPDDAAECLVPAEIALQIDKAIPKNDPTNPAAELTVAEHDTGKQIDARVQTGCGAITFSAGSPTEQFAPVGDAVWSGGGLASTRLGLELLIELLQTLKSSGADVVHIHLHHDDGKPAKIIGLGAEHQLTALQMPLAGRADEVES